MGILSGQPKEEPLHYGEVYGIWNYYLGAKSMLAGYQVLLNHTGDDDLKNFIGNVINDGIRREVKELEYIMKENGVALPPVPPERPEACLEEIPAGARINDPEIANSVAKDIAAGLVACSTMIGQCIREDLAAMFEQFHTKKAQFGYTILKMNKEKGWLVPPPLHTGGGKDC